MGLYAVNALCTAIAVVISGYTIWSHLKNYRKPTDQRLVVRILLLVPLFSLSAFSQLYAPSRAFANVLTILREIYEAFVIYTFYSLLTNVLGGERAIIYSKTGQPPVKFLCGVFSIDISDPYIFWIIKWLIMQYVWVRPIVVFLTSVVGDDHPLISWVLIIAYNISITVALNALMAFWVCLKGELAPYRVVLKFLSVKMIVFFSYWQVLALKVLSAFGFIDKHVLSTYENTLLCVECVGFALVHHYAFPASDYEATFRFGFARVKLQYAIKDVFGITDLIHDFRSTFLFPKYGPRDFDSVESVLDHPESHARQRRIAAGLRYKNGGKTKYWLPNTSLLSMDSPQTYGSTREAQNGNTADTLPTTAGLPENYVAGVEVNMEDEHSDGEEALYDLARRSFGDYNYPVIVVQETEEYVSFQERQRRQHVMNS